MRGASPGGAGACCLDCEFVPYKEVDKAGRTLAETELCGLDARSLYTLLVLLCLRVRKTVQEWAGVTVGEKVERRWEGAKVIVET